jgi:2-dehydro-3-deoxygluconokinase
MSKNLMIKNRENCQYDCVSLGEVMLRLDPGESRIHTTRSFAAWEGGGEYNVVRGLRRCFNKKTAIITALVDNAIGRLIEDCMLQGGVDTQLILWREDDGIGKNVRNGLNFTERGFGIRGALGIPDRGHSAASQMKVGDFDLDYLFGTLGSQWFHTGGIFIALSDSTMEVALQAVSIAKKHGTIVSYDLNYRPSLWKSQGGQKEAIRLNREIVKYVDVLIGNEEDFEAALGYCCDNKSNEYERLDQSHYVQTARQILDDYQQLFCVATTLRSVQTATINTWDAMICTRENVVNAKPFEQLEILDRVGGGDSFASGLIYGFLEEMDIKNALQIGLIHGALAMTTPGDTSMATVREIERILAGSRGRVIR